MSDAEKVHAIWNSFYPEDLMPQKGFVIHHIDGNHFNNEKNNLEKVTISKHSKIHNTGLKRSEATKKKISNSKSGVSFTEEHRQKLSDNHSDFSGENHPMYGRNHTEETKQKISKSKKGIPWNQKRRDAQYKKGVKNGHVI